MLDPVRIEPRLLNTPMFYGSPGEPQLSYLPQIGPRMMLPQTSGSLAPLLMGPLAMALMAPSGGRTANLQSTSGMIRRPSRPLAFDGLTFGKAFALARRIGLDEFAWHGKQYTTELK